MKPPIVESTTCQRMTPSGTRVVAILFAAAVPAHAADEWGDYRAVGWIVISVISSVAVFEWVSRFALSARLHAAWGTARRAILGRMVNVRRRRSIHTQAKKLESEIYQFYRDSDDGSR